MATFIGISENSHLPFTSYRSTAQGKLESSEAAGLRFTEIKILPIVELESLKDRERAERIMTKAAKTCLVANSVCAKVQVEPVFVFENAEAAA